MTKNELDDIVNALYIGHELEFSIDSKIYHFEPIESQKAEIWQLKNSTAVLVCTITGNTFGDVVDKFLYEKTFLKDSFECCAKDIAVIDVL